MVMMVFDGWYFLNGAERSGGFFAVIYLVWRASFLWKHDAAPREENKFGGCCAHRIIRCWRWGAWLRTWTAWPSATWSRAWSRPAVCVACHFHAPNKKLAERSDSLSCVAHHGIAWPPCCSFVVWPSTYHPWARLERIANKITQKREKITALDSTNLANQVCERERNGQRNWRRKT